MEILSSKYVTVSSVLFGKKHELYRVKITQLCNIDNSSHFLYLIENEMGDMISTGLMDVPKNFKVDRDICNRILKKYENEKYGEKSLTIIRRKK